VYADLIVLCPVPQLLDFFLETPDGGIIKPSTPAPNVKYVLGDQVVFYRVALPALAGDPAGSHGGQWKAILSLKSSGDLKKLSNDAAVLESIRTNGVRGSVPYSFVAHTYSNLNFTARADQDSLKPGAMVTLFASLKEYDVPLATDAIVWTQITNPDQTTVDLKLGKVAAGSYSASFKTSVPGVYTCRIRAEGLTSKGSAFTREKTVTAGVYYGNYDPVPPSKPSEDICRLIECFLSEHALTPALIRRLADMGIDLKHVKECVARICSGKMVVERNPDMKCGSFEAARRRVEQEKPTLDLSRAGAPVRVEPPARPVPKKMEPPTEPDSMFPPLTEDAKLDPAKKAGPKGGGKQAK